MKEFANKGVAEFISYAVVQAQANPAETVCTEACLENALTLGLGFTQTVSVPLSLSLGTVAVAALVVSDSLALRKWCSFSESVMDWHSRVS